MLPQPTQTFPKLGINCPEACSLNPNKIGWKHSNALAAARARGAGIPTLKRIAEELLEHPVPQTNMQRHVKHFVFPEPDAPAEPEPTVKPTDIEILDSIIVSGFRNSKNWKPSIRDTLEAMKLKTQMTGNSAFDDLIKLFDVDDDEDDEESAPEDLNALLSEEERPDEGDEELEEPLAGE